MSRFMVVDGSQSAHCCFDCTVVDTTKPVMYGDVRAGYFEAVCECFERADADMICEALNLAAEAA